MRVERAVFDINFLISGLLQPLGPPRGAVELLLALDGSFLFSDATYEELVTRLARPKFDRYVTRDIRDGYVARLAAQSVRVPVESLRLGCRDPEDDTVIATALAGGAQALVTGDLDHLGMPGVPGLAVVTARGFSTSRARPRPRSSSATWRPASCGPARGMGPVLAAGRAPVLRAGGGMVPQGGGISAWVARSSSTASPRRRVAVPR